MEFINRIELRGVVGRSEINNYNNSQVCNFSVVTEYSMVDRDGSPQVETTWFNVSAWNGKSINDLYGIQKGAWVRVVGRLRVRKYTAQNGEERSSTDVVARFVEVLPKEDFQMQPQRDY